MYYLLCAFFVKRPISSVSVFQEREEKTVRDLVKRQKREKTELEAELQALKVNRVVQGVLNVVPMFNGT